MNDTHGVNGTGWFGFDLDGTLAKYDKWRGIDNIGEPVDSMVSLMKRMHDEGKRVKILTARVSPRSNPETKPNPYHDEYMNVAKDDKDSLKTIKRCPWLTKKDWFAVDFVKDWCDDNLGFIPEITHEKDHLMLELYDDRVKQVVPNKGVLVEDEVKELVAMNHKNFILFNRLDAENLRLSRKLDRKWGGFFSGLYLGIILMLIGIGIAAYVEHRNRMPIEKSLQNLEQATTEATQAIKAWKED